MNIKIKRLMKGCGLPQAIGWDCNKGYLCDECWRKINIEEALTKYKKKVKKAMKTRLFLTEWDNEGTMLISKESLKMFNKEIGL